MTKKQLREAVNKYKFPSYGLFLSYFANEVLKKANLTALQDSSRELAYKSDGSYKPKTFDSLHKSCLEILSMISDGKIESAITLLKRSPVPEAGNKITYFLNDRKCTKSVYMSADSIPGKRTIKGMDTPTDLIVLLGLDDFIATAFSGTRQGEKYGIEKFGDDFKEEDIEKHPETGKPIVPDPVYKAPATQPEPDVNDFGDDVNADDYDEFKGHDEGIDEDWKNREDDDE